MQDYYATALHEIAHSTGHESRLNRFGAANDVGSYAIEELRAELASTFMQRELGISISGAHFENHAAYLNSWLNAVKNDKQLFFNAVRDAEKISDYVAEHYLNAERATELDAENTKEKTPVFDAKAVFSEQVDAVLSGADTTSTHIKVSNTPKILRDVGLPNLPILITAKHLRSITQDSGTESMNYHGLGEKAIKKLPELLADPVMIMDSLTREDSVVVLTEIFDKENRPVIAAIKIDGIGRQNGEIISANILTSVYGKDNFESFLNLNLQANTVLYWNKEKSQALSVNPGIQFPDVLATLDSDIIIRKSRAFVNSSAEKSFEKADINDETNARNRLAWVREYEVQQEKEIEEAREKAHEAGLPFSSAPFDSEEEFNPYVFDGSMSVEDYKLMHDDIEAAALLNAPLYGIVYDWKGLKEENTLYTAEQLQEHMPGFDSQTDLQEGAFDANKTYTVIKLNGSEEAETIHKVQSFLTGKYNYAPEGIDDWYWETRTDNLFTGEANPTAEKIIQYFNLKGEELSMRESKKENTNKEKYKTLKLGKEIIEVRGMYRNNLMRTYEEAKAEATTLTRETQEPYLVIGKSEAPAGIKTWFNEGNILPLSEAKRIFESLNEEFKREKQKAPIRFAIAYTFEGKEEFQEGLNYVFGAEKRDFQNVIEKHFRGNSNDLTSTDVKEPVQNAADGQERRSETLGEELTKQSIWLKIGLSEGAVGNKFGKNLLIRMPKGEYSGFGLFVDAKYIKTSTDGNSVLTVGDKLKYRINNDGRQVELTGAELKDVFAGKTLNKTPERVAPSKRNKAALDRLAKNIPAELKEQPCWGVYFTTPPKDPNKKKRDKVILSPTNGKWARANDPESWTDFETAMKYAREHNHEGLSLLLTKNSGITCIDLDECIDAAGKYNGIAEKLTNELNGTYTERSVSGNGLHIFVKDDVLKDGQYKSTARTEQGELEVYDSAHIISLTGDMVSKTNELTKSPTATTLYMRETLGERQRTNAPVIRDVNSTYRAGSDNEVIERIRKSKRGADFEALFTGKGITGNASVDDMKLANILVFFTDCDAAQSLRIMKSSASYRPDKSENYYTHTIGRAIETLSTRPMYGAGNRAGANKGKRGQGSER